MDLSMLIIYFFTIFVTCGNVLGRPHGNQLDSKVQKSKRAAAIDIQINEQRMKAEWLKRQKAERQLYLVRIMKRLDTHEQTPQFFISTENPLIGTSQKIYNAAKKLRKSTILRLRCRLRRKGKGRKTQKTKNKKKRRAKHLKSCQNYFHERNARNAKLSKVSVEESDFIENGLIE